MANIVANAFWTAVWKVGLSYAINSVTNKLFGPKQKRTSPTYSIGPLQTQTNAEMVMPIIYGEVNCAGNNLWQSGEGTTVQRLVGFGIGRNQGVSDVKLNDIPIGTNYLFTIKNNQYPDATITLYKTNSPTKNDKLLVLYANGVTKSILLGSANDLGKSGFNDYNCSTVKLRDYINGLGGGWVASSLTTRTDYNCEDIHDIATTSCYNNPVGTYVDGFKGLTGCSYTAYMGDGEQLIDDRVPGTQIEKARLVGGLKYDAYLALTISASDTLQGSPNVTALWKGRIVKIFYTPTLYYEAWTDNPAWCVFDFMTSIDGCDIPLEDMDVQTFLNAAVYFQPGDGSRHWTLNLILDEKKTRQDWLNEMLFTCRSWRTYQRGKHGILVDKPEPVSQIFTVRKTEKIQHNWQESKDDIERVIIKYPDPDYEWQLVGAPATIHPPFRGRKPLEKVTEIHGVTNFRQASQHAWFALNQAQTCQDWIIYECNKRAINRTIGDVIGIYDPITKLTEPGLPYKRYRIMAMTEPQGIKIQMVLREYNAAIYTDQLGSVAPVINVSTLPNTTVPPPAVTNMVLTEYGWMQDDGTHISNIDVSASPANYHDTVSYIISISEDGGQTWRNVNTVSAFPYRISNVANKNYIVGIQTVSRMGLVSARATVAIAVTGKDAPPGDVAKLTVTQAGTKLIAVVAEVEEPDIAKYSLRMGTTWGNSVQIEEFNGLRYTFDAPEEGTLTFWVKARDNIGNYSNKATKATVNVFGLPVKNIIAEIDSDPALWSTQKMWRDPWGRWQISTVEKIGDYAHFADIFGAVTHLQSDPSILLPVIDLGPNIIEDGYFWIDPWGNIQIKTVEKIADYEHFADIFGAVTHLQNVKYIAETFVSINVEYLKSDNNRVDIEYRTSVDGEHFGEWTAYFVKQFFGRYVQIGLSPISSDGITNVAIESARIIVDVPDVEDIVENIAIPAAKTHIAFNRKFYAEPKSLAIFTSDTTGKSATHRKTNITNAGFDLEILGTGDAVVAGKLDLVKIRGY